MHQSLSGLIYGALTTLFLLTGCSVDTFRMPPEDKINAAFPLPDTVATSVIALMGAAPAARQKEIQEQLATRMKTRAVTCAKGYAPAWYTSIDSIRKILDAQACFAEADAAIYRWVGMLRTGFALKMQAPASSGARLPGPILTNRSITWLRVASRAPVALVDTGLTFEVVNLETGTVMYTEGKETPQVGFISHNGRLFVRDENGKLVIKSTENGATYFELPGSNANNFIWLDDRTAIWNGNGKPVFIDFDLAAEIPMAPAKEKVLRAAAVPGEANHYVLLGTYRAQKVELNRGGDKPGVRLVAEKTSDRPMSWHVSGSILSGDGTQAIEFINTLSLLSLATLETETIDFSPWRVHTATPMAESGQFLLTGSAAGPYGEIEKRMYVASTGNQMLTQVNEKPEWAQPPASARYDYSGALKRNLAYSGNQIMILDPFPAGESVPLAIMKDEMIRTAQQHLLNSTRELMNRTDADRARLKAERDRIDEETRRYIPGYVRPSDAGLISPTARYPEAAGASILGDRKEHKELKERRSFGAR